MKLGPLSRCADGIDRNELDICQDLIEDLKSVLDNTFANFWKGVNLNVSAEPKKFEIIGKRSRFFGRDHTS